MLGKFFLVVGEEFPDDLFLPILARLDGLLQGARQLRHHHIHVIGVGLVQVFDDVLQIGIFKGFPGGPVALDGIDAADEEERFRVDSPLGAFFGHGGLPETETEAHAGSDAQQGKVQVHEVRHLHGGAHQMMVGVVTHIGKQS